MSKRYPILARAVTAALALGAGSAALAADFYLCAEETTLSVDGQNVPMWAFAEDDDADLSNGCGNAPTVPGPRLTVPEGDSNVTIHLRNNLSGHLSSYPGAGANIPVSIVVPGQITGMNPTFNADGRMRSLTHETLPGNVGTYSFSGFRPGTFMYHSASHMAVQVQMGLYGGITRDEANQQIYGNSYQAESLLFLSEIDPALHDAVDNGNYGPGTGTTSTIDYVPKYLLVNGELAGAGVQLGSGAPGDDVLVRLFNAGLTSRIPGLQGLEVSLLAEDGYAYPYAREQETIFLPALKTMDAMFTLPAVSPITGAYPVTDAAGGPGALIAKLVEGDSPPKGDDDIVEIVRTRFIANNSQLRVWATSSEADAATILTVDGYGVDGEMNYQATQALYDYFVNINGVASNPGSATVNSSEGGTDTKPVNYTLAPTANPDDYAVNEDDTLSEAAPGLLANDHKGGWVNNVEVATAILVSGPTNGNLTLNPDGSFDYTPVADFNGEDSFVYRMDIVNSNNGSTRDSSNDTQVTLSIAPQNDAPSAGADNYSVNAGATLVVDEVDGVLANDSDVDGDTLTATLVNDVTGGTLSLNADGSFSYTPDAATTQDQFSYAANDGTDMTPATVTIMVDAAGNSAPQANDDILQTVVDSQVTVAVTDNDSDAEGGLDPTTVMLTGNPNEGGTAVVNADGSITYTPPAGWTGSDSFSYTVQDVGGLTSNEALVRINVVTEANFVSTLNPDYANVHPLAVDNSFRRTGNRDRNFPVLNNDVDFDGDALDPATVEIIQQPDPAVATVVRITSSGAVRLSPAGGAQSGTSTSFTYVVRDERGAVSNEATCEVIWR